MHFVISEQIISRTDPGVGFTSELYQFEDLTTRKDVLVAEHQSGLYVLKVKPMSIVHSYSLVGNKSFQCMIANSNKLSMSLIQERLQRLSVSKLKQLSSCKDMDFSNFRCSTCLDAKFHPFPFPSGSFNSLHHFHLIHVDI